MKAAEWHACNDSAVFTNSNCTEMDCSPTCAPQAGGFSRQLPRQYIICRHYLIQGPSLAKQVDARLSDAFIASRRGRRRSISHYVSKAVRLVLSIGRTLTALAPLCLSLRYPRYLIYFAFTHVEESTLRQKKTLQHQQAGE